MGVDLGAMEEAPMEETLDEPEAASDEQAASAA